MTESKEKYMARRGKIARLPSEIREQLNQRMANGDSAQSMAEWLNALPDVRKVLDEFFQGEPVNDGNLTLWRQGGFRDWEAHEETRLLVKQMTEQDGNLHEDSDWEGVPERLAGVMSGRLCKTAIALLDSDEQLDAETRWRRTREILHEVARLRRCDTEARRTRNQECEQDAARGIRMRQECREDEERERLKQEREKRAYKDRNWAIWKAAARVEEVMDEFNCSMENAERLLEIEYDLPEGFLGRSRTDSEEDFLNFALGGEVGRAAQRVAHAKDQAAKWEAVLEDTLIKAKAAIDTTSHKPNPAPGKSKDE
jgi:hypothetical protein